MNIKEERENKEIEKLDLELKILKRPWFMRPANLISIVSLVFAMYQFDAAEKKKEQAKEIVKSTEQKAEYLDDKERNVLAAEKYLVQKTDRTTAQATAQTGRTMDVWAYGVSDSIVQKTREYLIAQGNTVGFGGLLSYRPSWLARESTVFYYSKNTQAVALQIADDLNKVTGITFKVSWGAGLGVNKDEKDKTFFVHIVN